MALRINFNYEAAVTQTSLSSNAIAISKSLLRLSTGIRVLNAYDDAAAISISNQLSLVAIGYKEANRNILTALSALRIAENAAGQIFDRLKEIYARATRAANDINDPDARASLQAEIRNLIDVIHRIGTSTEYNGIKLLDGTYKNKAIHYGPRNNLVVNVSVDDLRPTNLGAYLLAARTVVSNTGGLTTSAFPNHLYDNSQTATINGVSVTITASTTTPWSGTTYLIDAATFAKNINSNHTLSKEQGFKAYAKNSSTAAPFTGLLTINGNYNSVYSGLTFYIGDKSFELYGVQNDTLDALINKINTAASTKGAQVQASKINNRLVLNTSNGETIAVQVYVNISSTSPVSVTVNLDQLVEGAVAQTLNLNNSDGLASAIKTGEIKIISPEEFTVIFGSLNNAIGFGFSVQAPRSTKILDLYNIDVRNNEGAELGIMIADAAIRKVDRVRVNIGALISNLQSIYDAQRVALDNTQEAESVIRNTDYAKEILDFIKMQIKMQSTIAMLAQANQLPQLVLQLLK